MMILFKNTPRDKLSRISFIWISSLTFEFCYLNKNITLSVCFSEAIEYNKSVSFIIKVKAKQVI